MDKAIDRAWRCDCFGGHHLAITVWPGTDGHNGQGLDVESYLDVGGDFAATWRKRLSMAWNVLFKGHAHSGVGLALNAQKAQEIADVLAEYVRMDNAHNTSKAEVPENDSQPGS